MYIRFFTDNKNNSKRYVTKSLGYYMNSKVSDQAEFFWFTTAF